MVRRLTCVLGLDAPALGSIREVECCRIGDERGSQKHDEQRDQACPLGGVPVSSECPRAHSTRPRGDGDRHHERPSGQFLVEQRPDEGDGPDRGKPCGTAREPEMAVAPVQPPARARRQKQERHTPERRGMQHGQGRQGGQPVGVPRIRRQFEDVDIRRLDDPSDQQRVANDEGRRRDPNCELFRVKSTPATGLPIQRATCIPLEASPPDDGIRGQDDQRQPKQRGQQQVHRRQCDLRWAGPTVPLTGKRQREEHTGQKASGDQRPDGCSIGGRPARRIPSVQQGAARQDEGQPQQDGHPRRHLAAPGAARG